MPGPAPAPGPQKASPPATPADEAKCTARRALNSSSNTRLPAQVGDKPVSSLVRGYAHAHRTLRTPEASAVPSSTLLADLEVERALGLVRIDRQHAPVDLVGAGWQRLEADLQNVAAAATRLALVDAGAGRIAHLDGAQRRLDLFREPERYGARCRRHCAADTWIRAVERCVGVSRNCRERERQEKGEDSKDSHDQRPKAGPPGDVLLANSGRPME